MKRQRGRGRKPGGGGHHHHNNQGGGHHPNRTIDSNGPDNTKVRGPAALVFERYLQYARDASSSGDRVLSENYLQHADHYFRLVRAMQPATPVQQPQADRYNDGGDYEGDEEGPPEGDVSDEGASRAEGDEQQADGDETQSGERSREGGGDGEGRRRRGRNRNRFRPEGERTYEAREGEERSENREPREQREPREAREQREPRETREPREPRRERQPREDRDQSGPEGFSSGPKPAFLRGGGGE